MKMRDDTATGLRQRGKTVPEQQNAAPVNIPERGGRTEAHRPVRRCAGISAPCSVLKHAKGRGSELKLNTIEKLSDGKKIPMRKFFETVGSR